MLRSVDQSSDGERSLVCRSSQDCIIAIRGYNFQEGQPVATALLRQPVKAGVRWKRLFSSICLTRKSATSAREMNPDVQSFGSTSTRYAPVRGPLVRMVGRTIVQSSRLLRMM